MRVQSFLVCAPLRIKKALRIFTELIPRTRRTTGVAFSDPPSGSNKYRADKRRAAETTAAFSAENLHNV